MRGVVALREILRQLAVGHEMKHADFHGFLLGCGWYAGVSVRAFRVFVFAERQEQQRRDEQSHEERAQHRIVAAEMIVAETEEGGADADADREAGEYQAVQRSEGMTAE